MHMSMEVLGFMKILESLKKHRSMRMLEFMEKHESLEVLESLEEHMYLRKHRSLGKHRSVAKIKKNYLKLKGVEKCCQSMN